MDLGRGDSVFDWFLSFPSITSNGRWSNPSFPPLTLCAAKLQLLLSAPLNSSQKPPVTEGGFHFISTLRKVRFLQLCHENVEFSPLASVLIQSNIVSLSCLPAWTSWNCFVIRSSFYCQVNAISSRTFVFLRLYY